MSPAPAFTSVVGRPRPVSESENHCVQIVSSPSLGVFKESMPAGGEEASDGPGGWDQEVGFPWGRAQAVRPACTCPDRATLPSWCECFLPLPSCALKEQEGVERNPVAKGSFL